MKHLTPVTLQLAGADIGPPFFCLNRSYSMADSLNFFFNCRNIADFDKKCCTRIAFTVNMIHIKIIQFNSSIFLIYYKYEVASK